MGSLARDEFLSDVLPHFEAVILSPGPGTPSKPSDFGWAASLVQLCPVPILGVCLGMQGIATALGGQVRYAGKIEHGQRVDVANAGRGVFAGVDAALGKWVVYNSLVVDVECESLHSCSLALRGHQTRLLTRAHLLPHSATRRAPG